MNYKQYKTIFINTIILIFLLVIGYNIYEGIFTSKCVFSTADGIVHNESRNCTKNGDVLKNQFMIYQLNREESVLMIYMYEYSGSKENGVATDKIDDKNFLTLTRDYIDNYKSSKEYKKNLEFFDYIYKNFYPNKYEDFKRWIK